MKSAEYVASVVEPTAWCWMLPSRARKEALLAAKEILKFSFGRTADQGVPGLQQPDDIAKPLAEGGHRALTSARSRASRASA